MSRRERKPVNKVKMSRVYNLWSDWYKEMRELQDQWDREQKLITELRREVLEEYENKFQ